MDVDRKQRRRRAVWLISLPHRSRQKFSAMEAFLDQLHASARQLSPLYRLAIISRVLLALGFLPTGLVKLLGHRFTNLGTDNPVGAIFEAFYQTGFYWNFIGAGQVLAAILILIPRTTTLGALLFFPIIANITVLTFSVHFQGTTYVTALMLLANVFLLCWDYDRLRFVLFAPRERLQPPVHVPMPRIERVGYVLGVSSAMIVVLGTRGFVSGRVAIGMVGVCVIAVLLVLTGWLQLLRARPHHASTPPVGP